MMTLMESNLRSIGIDVMLSRTKKSVWFKIGLMAACFVALGSLSVSGQEEGQEVGVRVTDISFNHVVSPDFSGTGRGLPVKDIYTKQRWLGILITYESKVRDGEWADRVSFNWHVALRGEGKPLIMSQKVTYADVQEGEHYAVIYVRPAMIRRYYDRRRVSKSDLLVYIPIKANGQNVTRYLYPESSDDHPDGWWKFGAPRVVRREDGLLARTETPFRALDYDAFEHIVDTGNE